MRIRFGIVQYDIHIQELTKARESVSDIAAVFTTQNFSPVFLP